MTDTKAQIQDAQRTPSKINTKKSTPRHIMIKLQKTKIKDKNCIRLLFRKYASESKERKIFIKC